MAADPHRLSIGLIVTGLVLTSCLSFLLGVTVTLAVNGTAPAGTGDVVTVETAAAETEGHTPGEERAHETAPSSGAAADTAGMVGNAQTADTPSTAAADDASNPASGTTTGSEAAAAPATGTQTADAAQDRATPPADEPVEEINPPAISAVAQAAPPAPTDPETQPALAAAVANSAVTTARPATFMIDVGAFSKTDQARDFALRLQRAGYPSKISARDLGQGVHSITVWVGPYTSHRQAADIAADIGRETSLVPAIRQTSALVSTRPPPAPPAIN